jgi:hypothetical protein
MTTRLCCRECGWRSTYRRKRAAVRAAARHRCTTSPLAASHPQRRTRLRTTLWASRRGNSTDSITTAADAGAGDGELRDGPSSNRNRRVVLAVHHAETTRRARRAMIELVQAGGQVGPPPYGYRAISRRVSDRAAGTAVRAVLVPDHRTAAVVTRIFCWRADDGLSFAVIARRLNEDPRQYPPPGSSGRWCARNVRRIVTNVKYTGRQVWGRTSGGRPVPIAQWVMSAPGVHEPLIDPRTFYRAQPSATARRGRSANRADSPPRAA